MSTLEIQAKDLLGYDLHIENRSFNDILDENNAIQFDFHSHDLSAFFSNN